MLKKLLSLCLVLTMLFGVTACSKDDSKTTDSDNDNTNSTDDISRKERPFTESNGLIILQLVKIKYVYQKLLVNMLNI